MNDSVHSHTPVLSVIDGRGLEVRRVDYHRAQVGHGAERRVTLSRFDVGAQQRMQWDARLFEQEGNANQRQLSSLSSRPLLDDSSDAGWRLLLPGDAGQVLERWDGRGGHWQTGYDERMRPLWVCEQGSRVAQRFSYAVVEGANLRGRLIRQDDEAGTRCITGYSLTGEARCEARYFLDALDLPDWPEAIVGRDALLEPGEGAITSFTYGPIPFEKLEQTDARGNRQIFRYALSGKLCGLTVRLVDGVEHQVLRGIRFNAMDQAESRTAGNGVVSRSLYDPASGRLVRLTASRSGRSLLKDLHYSYDPLGNLLRIEDRSQPVGHFANQKIDPVSTFCYDSLSQLIETTGREAAIGMSGPDLPNLAPDPGDTRSLFNYREHYTYDPSGNLLSLRHVGQQPWTRTYRVAEQSNHALPEPSDPAESFDANGNLLHLGLGQPLQWSASNQLHGTRQVVRASGDNDEEQYRYGDHDLRLRKVAIRRVAGRMQRSETRYLPGLELHTRQGEAYAVVTAQTCRCLYWSDGQPDGIAGPQWRYTLGDAFDSSALELDGEARIISHEGYYPFGGTAWWAGRSAVEAAYKVRRYSGKERDSTGLYDYGLRYYAPWLARWISADPGGDVDGLNRYRMVGNNPLSLRDDWGLTGTRRSELAQGASTSAEARRIRAQFVEHEFNHKYLGGNMMGASYLGPDGKKNEFVNKFKPHKWTFQMNYKRTTGATSFYASDIAAHQYRVVAHTMGFAGQLPSVIKRENVSEETLSRLHGIENGSPLMFTTFFEKTTHGKSTQHILVEHGLEAQRVVVKRMSSNDRVADIYVDVAPAVAADLAPVDQQGERTDTEHGLAEPEVLPSQLARAPETLGLATVLPRIRRFSI